MRTLFYHTALIIFLGVFSLIFASRVPRTIASDSAPNIVLANSFESDGFSARLFYGSAIRFAQFGDKDLGGFMLAFEPTVHIAAVEFIDGRKGLRKVYPYISNFGLQYSVGKWFTLGRPEYAETGVRTFMLFNGLAMALVAAGIAVFAEREGGRISGLMVSLAFGLSPMMVYRALNPYWAMFLSFLPFVVMLYLYPASTRRRTFIIASLLTAALVGLKALAGYEYLTNVAVGSALPILYFELRTANGLTWRAISRVLWRSLFLGLCIALAVIVAMGMHVIKAALFFGSMRQGLQAITVPISYSTLSTPSGIRGDIVLNAQTILYSWYDTFLLKNSLIILPLYAMLAISIILVGALKRVTSADRARYFALWGTFLASLMVSASWMVLAVRHSIVHPHINWVLGYLFANVFAAMILGVNIRALLAPRTKNPNPAGRG